MPDTDQQTVPPIEASIEIDAPRERVWDTVSDLSRMGEWSPQTVVMKVLGQPRAGARIVNVNRDGLLVWPTTGRLTRWEPGHAMAWRVSQNRTVWGYELDEVPTGTRVVLRREAPDGIAAASTAAVKMAYRDYERFHAGLVRGMDASLARIRTAVERGV